MRGSGAGRQTWTNAGLEDVIGRQHIGAAIFTPFVVARLQGAERSAEATLTVDLRDIPQTVAARRALRLRWRSESVPAQPPGVQEKVATEWAACGIACAVAPFYTGLQVLSVADEGDRFDYWIGNAEQEFGLEVSGTLSELQGDLEARHRRKVQQPRENPYGVGGCVVGLVTRQVIFSFNRFVKGAE